jgi:hypothetical protein
VPETPAHAVQCSNRSSRESSPTVQGRCFGRPAKPDVPVRNQVTSARADRTFLCQDCTEVACDRSPRQQVNACQRDRSHGGADLQTMQRGIHAR